MINRTRIFSWVLVAATAIFLNACDRDSSTAAPGPSPAGAIPSPNPTTAPNPVADRSLSADEYIALGMPAYDRVWTGQDMSTSASRLQALATTAPQQLPRFNSSRSGPMFARIVARDNLDFFRSRSLPLASRFPQAIEYVESLNAILKVYLSASAANQVTSDDLIELMGAELRAIQVGLELVDEFLPTLSKDDPKYPVRMAGLDRMRQGLAGVVAGVITTLTEDQVYRVDARSKLLGYCRETFPSIVPKLSAPSRSEVLRRLDELVEDARVRDLRPQLISLRDELRGAAEATGPS
jgi:hypothetical protein